MDGPIGESEKVDLQERGRKASVETKARLRRATRGGLAVATMQQMPYEGMAHLGVDRKPRKYLRRAQVNKPNYLGFSRVRYALLLLVNCMVSALVRQLFRD